MAGKRKQSTPQQEDPRHRLLWAITWVVLAGLWLLLAVSLISHHRQDPPSLTHAMLSGPDAIGNWAGPLGAYLSHKAYLLLGPGVWVIMAAGLVYLVMTLAGRRIEQFWLRTIGVLFMAVVTSALYGMLEVVTAHGQFSAYQQGGLVSLFINHQLVVRVDLLGSFLILGVLFIVGLILTADELVISLPGRLLGRTLAAGRWVREPLAAGMRSAGAMGRTSSDRRNRRTDEDGPSWLASLAWPLTATTTFLRSRFASGAAADAEQSVDQETDETALDWEEEDADEEQITTAPEPRAAPVVAAAAEQPVHDPQALREKIRKLPVNFQNRLNPTKAADLPREQDLSGYQFPGLDLLSPIEQHVEDEEREALIRTHAHSLQTAMQTYGIDGEVVGIDSGPTITLYEVRLAPGTKVNSLNRVSSDLARALKAQNIRIVANMVGRDTVGVEVPNLQREKVTLRELITSDTSIPQKMKLPMWLGKDASGEQLIYDLTTMPHMLIAGTTGSGKSVCMNSIIMSFLFTRRPDELKMVLVDPKMVEMSMYKDIPHLMCPVVTEMSKAAAILEWAVTKMDERYELLAEAGVRDIAGYNELGWEEIKGRIQPINEQEEARIPRKLPYMVFIIDELADLIMTNKEVESFIVRIAQKARAVGLHLILATQRPQANVVTGLIKGNMPCRVSFRVASKLDSRIVLDQGGAELLLGHGDMMFLNPRTSKITRCQGTFIDDVEIRRTVKFLKNVAQPSYERQLTQLKAPGQGDVDDDTMQDPLFDQAVRVVLENERGSVSLLQRRLTIGYGRASRLIEAMGTAGILGEHKGSQAREVLMNLEEWEALKAQMAADADQQERSGTVFEQDDDALDAVDAYNADKNSDVVPDEIDDEYRR